MFVLSEGAGVYTEEIPLPASGQAQAGGPTPASASAAPDPPAMVKASERQVVRRGTFKQVVESLEAYKAAGITT